MTTAREICTRALRVINATPLGSDPDNAEIVEALAQLNEMMLGLSARNAVLEWSTLGLNDTIPLDEQYDSTLIHALGQCVAPSLGVTIADPYLARKMSEAKKLLEATFIPLESVRLDGFQRFSRNRRRH